MWAVDRMLVCSSVSLSVFSLAVASRTGPGARWTCGVYLILTVSCSTCLQSFHGVVAFDSLLQ